MKTLHCTAILAGVAILLASSGVWAAKGGKPTKPPKPPPDPTSVGHRYTVTVNEQVVFWGDDPLITGRIENAEGKTLLVNQGMVGGINPYASLNELERDPTCDNGGSWSACFSDPVDGTVQIPSSGTPHFSFGFTALNRSGKKLWYVFEAEAEAVSDEPWDLSWDLYNLGVDESISMALHGWQLEAGTGPVSKGCVGCGNFQGATIVTITRQEDTFLP